MDHDRGIKVRSFGVGDAVFVKNFNGSPTGLQEGNSKQRSLSLTIQFKNGAKVNRLVDHVRLHEIEGLIKASWLPKKGKRVMRRQMMTSYHHLCH